MIDRNVQRRAVTHETVCKPTTIVWGDKEIESPGVVERVRVYPRPDEKFISENLPYLATVGELARGGALTLYTSPELELERFTQRGPKDGWCGFDLLFDVNLHQVENPTHRTIAIGGSPFIKVGLSKKEKLAFLNSISAPRFVELKQILDPHVDDAYYIWTAECGQLDAFLTLDRRFYNHCQTNKGRLCSTVEIVTPKSLCEKLGKPPIDIDALAARHPWYR